MLAGVGRAPAADQAMVAINRNVVLVAKYRDRQVDQLAVGVAACRSLGLPYLTFQRASRSFFRSFDGLALQL